MNTPEKLLYTKNHEWVSLEGNMATVGITDYAQGELGDIVYVDISALEQDVKQDEVMGTIEAVKTVSDLFAPLTGQLVAVNPDLEGSPEKVNKSPYEEGWIAKIKLVNPAEAEGLLSAENYLKEIGQ